MSGIPTCPTNDVELSCFIAFKLASDIFQVCIMLSVQTDFKDYIKSSEGTSF